MNDDTLRPPQQPAASTVFRPIEARDNSTIESIVRAALANFDCAGTGYPGADAELAAMAAAFSGGESRYFVVEVDGIVRGGGGFGPLAATARDAGLAELRKMYFAPELRGRGVGRRFLAFLLDEMRDAGFAQAYLETATQMEAAQHLYRAAGFVKLDAPMGRTGRCRCDARFLKSL